MNNSQNLPDHFVRTYDKPFNVADFCKIMRSKGVALDKHAAADYLVTNPFLFGLTNGMFLTRAAVFNGYVFSFKPTKEEIEAGAFFVGHRCVPFVDFETLPTELTFAYRGQKLSTTTRSFKSDLVLDHFALFGEEYAVQYIASDRACESFNFDSEDFVIPNTLQLTCFSLLPLLSNGLKYGDSLLLRVLDWDAGILSVDIRPDSLLSPFERSSGEIESWNKALEDGLLSAFERLGPTGSIEEQLSNVFFEQRDSLDKNSCGSVEEFLLQSEKVGFEYFGVETRLWYAGETVPAIGDWNYIGGGNDREYMPEFFLFPDFVYDCFIIDQIINGDSNLDSLVRMIYPAELNINAAELLLLKTLLKHRLSVLKKHYNKFLDFDIIPIRHRAVVLFQDVYEMMFEIDNSKCDLKAMPQQELVILSQLYAHIIATLEALSYDGEEIEEIDEISASLDGMEFNFEDVIDVLKDAVTRQRNNGYAII